MNTRQIKNQIQKNTLALLSIIIALSALSYNSWRNEKTEENRNQRYSAFEIMRESAHLQLLVDLSTFSSKSEDNKLIQGWVRVNLMVSLSQLVSPVVKNKALILKEPLINAEFAKNN